jgi:hypothetical protein
MRWGLYASFVGGNRKLAAQLGPVGVGFERVARDECECK